MINPEYLKTKAARLQRIDAANASLPKSNTTAPADAEWKDPLPLQEFTRPEFPVSALPSPLAAFVTELARETQTPLDLGGLEVLAVVAASVAGKVFIRARASWFEPLNLYLVSALDVGNRKSAVFSACTAPLLAFEAQLIEDAAEQIAAAASDRRIQEKTLSELETHAGKADTVDEKGMRREEARALAIVLAATPIPVTPQLLASGDTTPEALAELVAEQKRIALMDDEGTLFEVIAGRYSNKPNIETLLKLHTGGPLKVNRRGRRIAVINGLATIGLSVQPSVLEGLSQQPTFRGRGLLARFLYAVPVSLVGWRISRPKPMTERTRLAYADVVKNLLTWQLADEQAADEQAAEVCLELTAEADLLLEHLQDEIEEQLKPHSGKLAHIGDWAAKLCGATVRMAGVLHCLQYAMNPETMPTLVSVGTLQNAIALGEYFKAHALAAFGLMGADPTVAAAKYLLGWITAQQPDAFARREAHQANRGRFPKAEDIDPALTVLCEHGYICVISGTEKPSAGRRPSPRYAVNPKLLTVSQNAQNTQNHAAKAIVSNVSNVRDSNESLKVATDAEDWGEA